MVLLIPLINPLLKRLNRKGTIVFLAVSWLLWYVVASTGTMFFELQKGLFFYSIGGIIRLYDNKNEKPRISQLFIFLFAWVVGTIFAYFIASMGAIKDESSSTQRVLKEVLPVIETGIVVPICGISLFLFLKSINVKQSKIINIVASTTFGVYLLHDSIIVRSTLWYMLVRNNPNLYSSSLFPCFAILIILGVFIVCSILDYMRIKIIEPVLLKASEKMEQRIGCLFK